MTPQRIQWLDRWVGYPICLLLSGVEWVRRRFVPLPDRPRRLIFVKLIEMGSTVLAAPAFEEAISRLGRDNVFMLLFKRNRPIADVMALLPAENILAVDDSSLGCFLRDMVTVLRRIRRERIDTAVDLEGLTRASAIITWLTGARRRVGYYNFTAEGPYRGRLFNIELNYNFQRHVAAAFLAMTRAAFVRDAQRPFLKESVPSGPWRLPRFQPRPGEGEGLIAKIEQQAAGSLRRPLIVLNPNCSDLLPLRRWPDDRFVDLGQRILREHPQAMLVISGGPDERDGAAAIARSIDSQGQRCVSLAGQTSFRELLVLLALADVMVSNDSGPCHFAALTDIGVVALFGPETPGLYGPLGSRVRTVSTGLACSPCVNMLNHRFSPCRDNRCMQTLSVDSVYQALREVCPLPDGAAVDATVRSTVR